MMLTKEAEKEFEGYLLSKPREDLDNIEAKSVPHIMGCTACIALLTPTELYVANVGDSRAVLSQAGKAINLSEDHKTTLEKEQQRIINAGGFIAEERVNGILNMSRCLGDLELKQNSKLKQDEQILSAVPDVTVKKLTPGIDFLIIACDGIWDCMTSQQAIDYVKEALKLTKEIKGFKISSVIGNMLDTIIADNTDSSEEVGCDNMTCMVIVLRK